eukprot:COSAG05_NODE_2564_length_2893_cov_2.093772_1_plen_68_part_00
MRCRVLKFSWYSPRRARLDGQRYAFLGCETATLVVSLVFDNDLAHYVAASKCFELKTLEREHPRVLY